MKKPSIEVVSEAEAEEAEAVVCLRAADDPGYFKDNLRGLCHDCGTEVIFRPTAPKAPMKLCMTCALERGSGGTA